MRNLIPILLALVVLSSGCDPDGYSCNSEGCYADDDSPQYQTLEDCLSVCDEITPVPAVFNSCGDDIGHEGHPRGPRRRYGGGGAAPCGA